MSEPEEATESGPFASARGVAGSVLTLLQKRGELAALEFQEQRHRLLDQLIRLAVAVVLALMMLITGTFLVVALTWDTAARFWVLCGLTLAYGGGALACWRQVRRIQAESPPPFAATLEEFKKDRAWFQDKN